MTPQDIWNATKIQLEFQLDRGSYDTWVRAAHYLDFLPDDNLFIVAVPNAYIQDMLQNRLYRNIRRILSNISGGAVEVRFDVVKREPIALPPVSDDDMPLFKYLRQQNPAPEPMSDLNGIPEVIRPHTPDLVETELKPEYTFDRFVVNRSNQMAHEAARAVAEFPATVYNPFLIYGGVGVGKTHLLTAIAHVCRQRGLKTLFIPSEVFVTELMIAIRHRTQAMFQQKYRTVDVLLMDDVQFLGGKESTQEEFFHTFNALVQANRQIVMVSDRHPREMLTLDERLRSRVGGGLVADISAPEYETRRLIVEMWAREQHQFLDSHITHAIAERTTGGNIRDLYNAFLQLVHQMRHNNNTITTPQVQRTLDQLSAPRERLTIDRIVTITAQKFGVLPADLTGKKRTELINVARQVAMYLTREMTQYSLSQIGDAFGRNHTTVLHGCNKVTEDMQVDPVLRARVEKIKQSLAQFS